MDGAHSFPELGLDQSALDRLMPMHLHLSCDGVIQSAGPTLAKLMPQIRMVGRDVFELFVIRRPGGITSMQGLIARKHERLYMAPLGCGMSALRGIAVPAQLGSGLLINLSFGIGVLEAVRHHALTDADFAPTDLTVELLYLVEAKTAVTAELRNLNLRLQGAKIAAEEQALTDTLTGLRNRRALDIDLDRLMQHRSDFGMMHIDLDYFKAVNDTLGHAAGDHVLREVAQVLLAETRVGDTVARVGGDEFVMIFPGLINADLLAEIAGRIIDRLGQPISFDGQPCKIAGSIGMTLSTLYASPDPDRMLNDADTALYASKHAGRGRATLHAPAAELAHPAPKPNRRTAE